MARIGLLKICDLLDRRNNDTRAAETCALVLFLWTLNRPD
jgi:hypothetical protein